MWVCVGWWDVWVCGWEGCVGVWVGEMCGVECVGCVGGGMGMGGMCGWVGDVNIHEICETLITCCEFV